MDGFRLFKRSWINGSHYRDDQIQTLNAAIRFLGIIPEQGLPNGVSCHSSDEPIISDSIC